MNNNDEQVELEDFGGDGIDYTSRFCQPLEFDSLEAAYSWAKDVAHDIGFGLVKASSKHRRYKDSLYHKVICERGGVYRARLRDPKKPMRHHTTTKKCLCPFGFAIVSKDGGINYAIVPVKGGGFHNHKFHKYFDGHRQMTEFTPKQFAYIEQGVGAEVSIKKIKHGYMRKFGKTSKAMPINRQYYNASRKIRAREREGRNRAEQMFHLANEKGYMSFRDKDPKTGKLHRIMMVHPVALSMLKVWYYVIGIDSIYKTNMYKMPLVQLVGVSPVGNNFLVGYAILGDEKTESYIWVLENLGHLLGDDLVPTSFVTDRELGLMAALPHVFPASHHLLCLWHVEKAVENKAKECTESGELGKSFLEKKWRRLVNCRTEVDLEIAMEGLRYYKNRELVHYLKNTWYVHAMKYVKCYTNDVLHFGTTTTSRVESAHATLKRWLGTSTLGLDSLWKKIDALIDGQQNEIRGSLEVSRNRH